MAKRPRKPTSGRAPAQIQAACGAAQDRFGVWLVALPMIAGLLAWPADMVDPEGTVSMVLGFGVIAGTALLAQLDSRRWEYPGAHFAWLLLAWIVFYPLYMWRRTRRFGAPPKFAWSLLAILVFVHKDILTALDDLL